MTGVRIDKWLWAARFFKVRTLAVKACDMGRITIAGQAVKPSRDVKVGDLLRVKNEAGEFEIEVMALSDTRGPAAVAQTLYRETEASQSLRARLAEQRKLMDPFDALPQGRPSKRDRREINTLRGRR